MALATPTAATPTRQRPLGRTRSPASSPARWLSGGHKRPIGPPVTGDRLSARPGGAAHVPDGSAPRSACHRLVNGPPIRSGTPGPHTRHPPLRVRPPTARADPLPRGRTAVFLLFLKLNWKNGSGKVAPGHRRHPSTPAFAGFASGNPRAPPARERCGLVGKELRLQLR